MKTITIRQLTIGTGIPKICTPIVGTTKAEILSQAEALLSFPVDLAEWRADWYEDAFDLQRVLDTAASLRKILQDIPLLFTFRTAAEGGRQRISPEQYQALNIAVSDSRLVDFIDAEAFLDKPAVSAIIHAAHKNQIYIIASNHNFEETPGKAELIRRLCCMQELGADITKIAVMPNSRQDVLALLSASIEMREHYADRPFVTMSMGQTGVISRLIGEFSGSSITFGTAGAASAPGQIEAAALAQILELIHNSML